VLPSVTLEKDGRRNCHGQKAEKTEPLWTFLSTLPCSILIVSHRYYLHDVNKNLKIKIIFTPFQVITH